MEGAAGDGGEDGTQGVGLLQAGGLVVTEVDHHLGAIPTQSRDKLSYNIFSVLYCTDSGLFEGLFFNL